MLFVGIGYNAFQKKKFKIILHFELIRNHCSGWILFQTPMEGEANGSTYFKNLT
jgi:hypothetical protein